MRRGAASRGREPASWRRAELSRRQRVDVPRLTIVAPRARGGGTQDIFAPRVAALRDVMQIREILAVEGPNTFTRASYAGNAIATVQTSRLIT